jgi:hypothetical protein
MYLLTNTNCFNLTTVQYISLSSVKKTEFIVFQNSYYTDIYIALSPYEMEFTEKERYFPMGISASVKDVMV